MNEPSSQRSFREAFDRLKANKPVRMAKGTRVSQNNVAKEAGRDPSALKKSRYPNLINDIQTWLHDHPAASHTSNQKKITSQRSVNKKLRERIDEITAQRDHLSCLLVQADSKILELSRKVATLEAMHPNNVVTIFSADELAR